MGAKLDDLAFYPAFDPDGMLGTIRDLPQQVRNAWKIAQAAPLPDTYRDVRRVVITGMGGSAIGADLLIGLLAHGGRVPVELVRGYELPTSVAGADTLVVASSYSGNTEETLSAFAEAQERGTRLLAITGGGKLAAMAEAAGAPVWRFSYKSTPRAAVGYSFALLLGLICRLGIYADAAETLELAAQALEHLQVGLLPESPTEKNLAKQMAEALEGKLPVIFGAGFLAPVARRWKGQFNENSKEWASWDEMPELNHNAVVGLGLPGALVPQLGVFFLRSPLDHSRVQMRWDVTGELLAQNKVALYPMYGEGESALAQMLTLIHVGDFISYYVAALNQVDPSPVDNITYLKKQLERTA